MAVFQSIRDEAIRAVDAVMSERIMHFPLRQQQPDPHRSKREIHAVLRVGGLRDKPAEGGKSWMARIAQGRAECHIDRSTQPNIDIRQGDRIRAVERVGQPIFDVLQVQERHHGRIVVGLGES